MARGYACLVPGCNGISSINRPRGFFRFPKTVVTLNERKASINLLMSIERRFKWINAIKRGDLTDAMINKQGICGIHFIRGKPSKLSDIKNPDWVPSLFLDMRGINRKNRLKWFKAAGFTCSAARSMNVFCCEDHFDLKKDAKRQYSETSGVTLTLRKGVVPHLNLLQYNIEFYLSKLTDDTEQNILEFTKDYFHGRNKLMSQQMHCADKNEVEKVRGLSTSDNGKQADFLLINVEKQTISESDLLQSLNTYIDDEITDEQHSINVDSTAPLPDLSMSCRTCLQIMRTNRNLDQPGGTKLLQVLEYLTHIPLTLNDNGVFNVCKSCEGKLTNISAFRQMCLYTHKRYNHDIELQESISPQSFNINNSNKRKFVFDHTQPKKKVKSNQQRVPYLNTRLVSSEDILSAEDTLIPSDDSLLLNSINPSIMNNKLKNEQCEEEVNHVDPSTDLIDPLALTELDNLDPLVTKLEESIDPLSLDTTDLLEPTNGVESKLELVKRYKTSIGGINFTNPQIVMVKRFNLLNYRTKPMPATQNMPTKRDLSQPFPQKSQRKKYMITTTRDTKSILHNVLQSKEAKVADITMDHTYATFVKEPKLVLSARACLVQHPSKIVVAAIEGVKLELLEQKPLDCQFCRRIAKNVPAMSLHVQRQHAEHFPNWCSYCNKHVHNLKQHRRSRYDCLVFTCKFCFKSFKTSKTLLRHLEYHDRKHFFPDLIIKTTELEPQITNSSDNSPVSDKFVKPDPLKTFNYIPTINSKSALNVLESSSIAASQNPAKHIMSSHTIKQEIDFEQDVELQYQLNEEIDIKEEPLSEQMVDYTDN